MFIKLNIINLFYKGFQKFKYLCIKNYLKRYDKGKKSRIHDNS